MDATLAVATPWRELTLRRRSAGPNMTTLTEGRDRLRAALSLGEPRDADTEAFLTSLQWRVRRAAELVYGQGWTQDRAARELGISRRTLVRDLTYVVRLYARR
jgi:DNA-directed RNA polymerase specialized sigma24 family protein